MHLQVLHMLQAGWIPVTISVLLHPAPFAETCYQTGTSVPDNSHHHLTEKACRYQRLLDSAITSSEPGSETGIHWYDGGERVIAIATAYVIGWNNVFTVQNGMRMHLPVSVMVMDGSMHLSGQALSGLLETGISLRSDCDRRVLTAILLSSIRLMNPHMDLIPCSVRGVFVAVSPAGASPVVLLDLGDDTCLPIYIGLWEAISINTALNNEIAPRPQTHDLFLEFLNRYQVTLRALHIDSLEDGVYYANLMLYSGTIRKK